MTMGSPGNLFTMVQRGMSAQLVRMNAATSNLVNAGSVAGSEQTAYRPIRPVFAAEVDRATGLSSVRVAGVTPGEASPIRRHDPDHPLADAEGFVWEAPIDEAGEMVEIMESARHYQNLVEALQTAKQLMLDTMRSS